MKSIAFPKMFNSNSTRISTDFEATRQNTKLLLKSEQGELFGDPYFGPRIKKYIFDQNNLILRDIIIDEIYTQIALFLPQLIVNRKDIKIRFEKAKMICYFKGVNQANFEVDSYNLVLYDEDINI